MINENKRVSLKNLDGLSIKDAKRIPHPCDLMDWLEKGFYYIDTELSVFKLTETGKIQN